MTLKEALKRIEELERRVKELEARPPQEFHTHYHPAPYIPALPYQPITNPFQYPHWGSALTATAINPELCGSTHNQ